MSVCILLFLLLFYFSAFVVLKQKMHFSSSRISNCFHIVCQVCFECTEFWWMSFFFPVCPETIDFYMIIRNASLDTLFTCQIVFDYSSHIHYLLIMDLSQTSIYLTMQSPISSWPWTSLILWHEMQSLPLYHIFLVVLMCFTLVWLM